MAITRLAFNPRDERLLASGGTDSALRIWDVDKGEEVRVLQGPGRVVTAIGFAQGGDYLAAEWDGEETSAWNAFSGEPFRLPGGHEDRTHDVRPALLPRPAPILIRSDFATGETQIREARTQRVLATLEHSRMDLRDGQLEVSGDTSTLAFCRRDGQDVELIDIPSCTAFHSLVGHSDKVTCLAFSPDSRVLATGSQDESVLLWDVKTGGVINRLTGHSSPVARVFFAVGGSAIVSVTASGHYRVWDATTGALRCQLAGQISRLTRHAFSSDGAQLATAANHPIAGETELRGEIRLWSLSSGQLLHDLGASLPPIESVAFSLKGRFLAAGALHTNGTSDWDPIFVWRCATGDLHCRLRGHWHHYS